MKYRYLIETSGDEDRPFALSTITKDDTDGHGFSVATVEEAKALAGKDPCLDNPIRWREAPEPWRPDALLISQWIDDGVEDET